MVDGFGSGAVSRDGEARNFAEGKVMGIIDNAKELADLLKAAGNTELYRKIVELEGEIIELTRQNPNRSPSRLMTRILSSSVSSVARSNHRR